MFYSPAPLYGINGGGGVTHKLFLPAILGCVAHDPPSTTLCFPSKKSATQISLPSQKSIMGYIQSYSPVYPGYNSISLNPSCLSSTELVHSHTPPISPCPANLSPYAVTATGCQCLKPTLAPSRSVKSACWAAAAGESAGWRRGGLSSTPLLTRWLAGVSL